MIKDEFYVLNNNVLIPKIGFGTWQVNDGMEAYNAVKWAIECGYRHIDTAYVYGNEKSVALAIKDSKIKRSDVFITTKCPAEIKTYEGCKEYFFKSLKNLNTDYIDLYLIHAPWPWNNVGLDCNLGNIEVWRAMIDLYNDGKVRAIGVSNFSVDDIKNLYKATNFMPMVNQIRFFLGNTQENITKYCQDNNILIQAYSPLATSELLNNNKIEEFAKKYNTTTAKICLRYCIQRNINPLPKSVHKERIKENLDIDFEISNDDMKYLNSLYHIASTRPYRS